MNRIGYSGTAIPCAVGGDSHGRGGREAWHTLMSQ